MCLCFLFRLFYFIIQSSMRVGKRNRSEKRVTYMVGIMIAAFMIAWTPYSVFSLIKQFGDPTTIGPAMAVLPSLFAKTSICYNPIIYVGMNSQVRHNLSVLSRFLFSSGRVAGRQTHFNKSPQNHRHHRTHHKRRPPHPPDRPSFTQCSRSDTIFEI